MIPVLDSFKRIHGINDRLMVPCQADRFEWHEWKHNPDKIRGNQVVLQKINEHAAGTNTVSQTDVVVIEKNDEHAYIVL